MADTSENFTMKLDNAITALNVLLNENDGTFARDELVNYNTSVMIQKKLVKDIATENMLLNRVIQLYNLGIWINSHQIFLWSSAKFLFECSNKMTSSAVANF